MLALPTVNRRSACKGYRPGAAATAKTFERATRATSSATSWLERQEVAA